MSTFDMGGRADKIRNFVTVQLIALIGWIIVQSLFTYFSVRYNFISFPLIMVVETIWWIATLVIMFRMFRKILDDFVQNVLQLEEANDKLRQKTNRFLLDQVSRDSQEEQVSRGGEEENPGLGSPEPA